MSFFTIVTCFFAVKWRKVFDGVVKNRNFASEVYTLKY